MSRPWNSAAVAVLGCLACGEPLKPARSGGGGLALRIIPAAAGVATLESAYVRLRGPTDKTVKPTPGATTVTIAGLTPGTYTVALEGFSGGGVDRFGETTGVQVTAGQNTTATLRITSFVPVVDSLPLFGRGSFTVTYSSVPDAASYEVEAATDQAFTINRVVVPGTATSTQVTESDYGTFYIRVRAIDSYQGRGRPSAFQSIVLTRVLFMIRDGDGMLQMLDPGSLRIINVGSLGVGYAFGDCAWNPANNTLYMVDGRAAKMLYRINLTTGMASPVGAHGVTDMFALGYHPPTNALYGVSGDGNLYRLSLTTGAARLIGATGPTGGINGLAWDSARSQFVALTANVGGGQLLYTIDVATGAATPLASSPGIDNNGLTYDAVIDRFWAAEYSGDIHQYNPASGYARTTVATGKGPHTCIADVP